MSSVWCILASIPWRSPNSTQEKCEGFIDVTGPGGTLRMNDPCLCHNSRPMASRQTPQVVYGIHLNSEIFVLIYRMQCVIGPGFCLRLQKGQFGYGLGFCMRRIGTSREVRISDRRSWRHGVSERLHAGVQNLSFASRRSLHESTSPRLWSPSSFCSFAQHCWLNHNVNLWKWKMDTQSSAVDEPPLR